MKRVLILGIDGYIGWALANYLLAQPDKYKVCGVDDLSRRNLVHHIGGDSLTPILPFSSRDNYLRHQRGFIDSVAKIDISEYYHISSVLHEFKPDVIVHLAEQPSAPFSMRSPRDSINTQENNILGTLSLLWAIRSDCPDAHLIKLGTMGEYGTPNCNIPEGEIPEFPCAPAEIENVPCPMQGLMFPRSPGSFYHLSKVHDTYNIIFACKTWGLTSTDIMQGVVFGVRIGNEASNLLTRFDYDEYFGTVINRFCVQSLCNIPLTIYGSGKQVRGYLPLKDSIQCLTIAIDNPPAKGEYRTLNQFENIYSINDLAGEVLDAASYLGIDSKTQHLPNPRTEADSHYYNPEHQKLFDLGYVPTTDIRAEIIKLINDLIPFKDRIIKEHILPTTTWR
jgi:UDP-sulfoquinovose synthase